MTVLGLAQIASNTVRQMMQDVGDQEIREIIRLRDNAYRALDLLNQTDSGTLCSERFHEELRAVAYLPDGLNEFLVLSGRDILCSSSVARFVSPLRLREPDLVDVGARQASYWFDERLDFLGLRGRSGTIVSVGRFAVVVPVVEIGAMLSEWFRVDVHTVAADGREWHRGGTEGVREAALRVQQSTFLPDLVMHHTACDELDCVTVEADLNQLFKAQPWRPVAGALLCMLLSGLVAAVFATWLRRYWSFEARFIRHLDADSVVCNYQPLMRLSDGAFVGCEVLARWRDLDDTLVYPDKFIPLVEKAGLTSQFTRHVAKRAFAELSAGLPAGARLSVNFNIFPGDLEAEKLFSIFEDFRDEGDRFDVTLEIVETEGLDLRTAGAEIEKLQRCGFKVYMDDFGTGYFSVESLTRLQLDGIKLDRCFAMAPEGSVMSRMLGIVLEMISVTGRPIVVEGIETAETLQKLRREPRIATFGQGYGISRPLPAADFFRFLYRERDDSSSEQAA